MISCRHETAGSDVLLSPPVLGVMLHHAPDAGSRAKDVMQHSPVSGNILRPAAD